MNKVMLITGATSDLAIELLNNIKNEDITILAFYNDYVEKLYIIDISNIVL